MNNSIEINKRKEELDLLQSALTGTEFSSPIEKSEHHRHQVKRIEISAKYIKQALRNVGYTVETALSELVDNSFDAKPRSYINIELPSKTEMRKGRPIEIRDNADGMSYDELVGAFDLGCSIRKYGKDDLGQYGTGLKTALAYLCDYAIVETRKEGDDFVSRAEWDIENNTLDINIYTRKLNKNENFEPGTNIIMQPGSRIDCFTYTQISYVMKMFSARYEPSLKNGIIQMRMNNSEIIPFDPMYRNNPRVLKNDIDVPLVIDNKEIIIKLEGSFIEDCEPIGFDKKNNRSCFSFNHQGAYVCYVDRKNINLGGTWLGGRENHYGMIGTRVKVIVPKEATEYFGISMNKTKSIDFKAANYDDDLIKTEDENDIHTNYKIIAEKLASIAAWGQKLHNDKEDKEKTTDKGDIEFLTKFNKKFNNILKEKGINKNSSGLSSLSDSILKTKNNEKDEQKKEIDKTNKDRKYNKPTPQSNDIVKINYYNGDRNGECFKIGKDGKKLLLNFNKQHSFFDDYLDNNPERSARTIKIIWSLSQLILKEYEINESAVDKWDEFIYDFSKNINRIIDRKKTKNSEEDIQDIDFEEYFE